MSTPLRLAEPSLSAAAHAAALTQHRADLVAQNGVGVVQPASSAQALLEAVEDGLIGQQHHQNPQSCCHRAGVEMFFHEHQKPVKAQRSYQLLTRPAGRTFSRLVLLSKLHFNTRFFFTTF